MIPCKSFFIKINIIESGQQIEDISGWLFWISNTGGRFKELSNYADGKEDYYVKGFDFITEMGKILKMKLI